MEIEKWNAVPDGFITSILSQIDSFLAVKADPGGRVLDEDGQINLVDQLHALYDEIEAAGGRRPLELARENATLVAEASKLRQQLEGLDAAYRTGLAPRSGGFDASLVAQLESFYAEVEAAGGRGPRELAEICDQLVAQLDSLYLEIDQAGGRRPLEQKELIESLVEQLHALYEERERDAQSSSAADVRRIRDMVGSLVEQLHALYAEREADPRDDMIESLAAQLHEMYAEREGRGGEEMVESLLAQLHDLYAEKERAHAAGEPMVARVESLDAEKRALEARVESLTHQLGVVRERARRMASALTLSALEA